MGRMKFIISTLFVVVSIFNSSCLSVNDEVNDERNCRLIVTTDLGGTDPDDIQSMIHLLLCSNMVDIEGLISSNAWVDGPDNSRKIMEIVDSFGVVLPNLKVHMDGFPDVDYLKSIVKRGQDKANMDGVGDNKDSPGSELIYASVMKEDPRPIWLVAWGGMNTIAQAIWKAKKNLNNEELKTFISKIRIYDILGQDDAGAWIAKNFPNLFYIRNKKVYGWAPDDEWVKNNIQNIGPLGKCYPNRIWATEGDSPSFLYVLSNGLNLPDSISYGGWGGRFSKEKHINIRGMSFVSEVGKDEGQYDPYYMYGSEKEGIAAINKWRQHILNDFAVRMLWTTTSVYEDVNHYPVVKVNGSGSKKCMFIDTEAGSDLEFDAGESYDPDYDQINYRWFVYREPSTYKGMINLEKKSNGVCRFNVPLDAKGKNIHLILEITDDGSPQLTSYKRFVLNVK